MVSRVFRPARALFARGSFARFGLARFGLALLIAAPVAQAAPVSRGSWPSGRPPECAIEGSAANVWDRARSPELRRYCDLLASAASKLAGTSAMAQAAFAAAREADDVLPGYAAPRVLEGRALASLGKFAEALAALRDGNARDPSALDDPLALHAWARVLARTGHVTEAIEAYRTLLPRTTSLSSAERSASAVEAGLVSMAAGPGGVDDAVAALREAVREAQDDTLNVAIPALALALDRRGDRSEARALLTDRIHGDVRTSLEGARAKELLGVAPEEQPAIVGLALDGVDPAGAHDAWTQYLAVARPDGAPGPWDAYARAHLTATSAGGHVSRRKAP